MNKPLGFPFARALRAGAVFVLSLAISGGSCVGPAEIANGAPADFLSDVDFSLVGYWVGVEYVDFEVEADKKEHVQYEGLSLVLWPVRGDAKGHRKLGAIWLYGLDSIGLFGACFATEAQPFVVDGTTYYDVTWNLVATERESGFSSCKQYMPEVEKPGHIIVKAFLNEKGHLYLRFLNNETLLHLSDQGHFKATVVEAEEDKLIDRHLLVDLSSEALVAMLRGIPEEALFFDPVGPFVRLDIHAPPIKRTGNLSGTLYD